MSASPVSIRKAAQEDAILLSRLGAETFSDAFGADNSPEDMTLYLEAAFRPEIQAAELADPSSVFLLAQDGPEPVGYARIRQGIPPSAVIASRPIEIVRLYARKAWIGRGVGRALMSACLDEARDRGCDVIWLDVWERNPRAIAFYARWGFVVVGNQPFRLGNDAQNDLLMARAVVNAHAA